MKKNERRSKGEMELIGQRPHHGGLGLGGLRVGGVAGPLSRDSASHCHPRIVSDKRALSPRQWHDAAKKPVALCGSASTGMMSGIGSARL